MEEIELTDEKLIAWFYIAEDYPKVSDIHRFYDKIAKTGILACDIKVGLIFDKYQYNIFKTTLLKLFDVDLSRDIKDFMGMTIKII